MEVVEALVESRTGCWKFEDRLIVCAGRTEVAVTGCRWDVFVNVWTFGDRKLVPVNDTGGTGVSVDMVNLGTYCEESNDPREDQKGETTFNGQHVAKLV